jgi:hypothetical protein
MNTHYGPDGTHFFTAQESLAALSSEFPNYLIYPDAAVVSSGKIEDPMGGVISVLVRTGDSPSQVLDYYQQTLWLQRWELLTRLDQEEVVILTFEEDAVDKAVTTPSRQVVIQLGPTTKLAEREILLLFSWVNDLEGGSSPPWGMQTFAQWLLADHHQALVQHLSTLHPSRTGSLSESW